MALTAAAQVDRSRTLSLSGRALLAMARWARRRSAFHVGGQADVTGSREKYDAWREASLGWQLVDHFDVTALVGKDVLDFGCGSGGLSELVARRFGARRVIGVDMGARAIGRARARLKGRDCADRVTYCHSQDDRRIDAESQSVDIICCFDVLEHVPHVRETVGEWRRVLRQGGEVWIWWSPWMGPYGHHVEWLIPLPWVHLLFSPETVFSVCAEVYDDPAFSPRVWDRDESTGQARENKWRGVTRYEPFLNRLRSGAFERVARESGFDILERRRVGFGGSRLGRMTRALIPAPIVGECFVSYFVYRLGRS